MPLPKMRSRACQAVSTDFSIGLYFRSPFEHLPLLLRSVSAELGVSRGGAAEGSAPGDDFPLSPPRGIAAWVDAEDLGRTCSSPPGGHVVSTWCERG